MKKLYIILILTFALVLSIQAQNEYRIEDNLHTQQVSYMSFEQLKGQELVWNMNDCKVLNADYSVKFVANRDSFFHAPLSRLEAGTNYRYDIHDNTMFLKGFKNKTTRIKYDIPIATMRLPLVYNDELQGVYSGKGEDFMEHCVRIFGNYHTKVCGKGTLVTLDGDSLQNTLLVHSQRTISSTFSSLQKQLSQYGTLDSIPSLSPDSIPEIVKNDSDKLIMDTYSWFAPGYRYAVLETVKIYQALPPNAPILQTAFYNAIDDQANLFDDEENAAIRRAILKNDSPYLCASERMGQAGTSIICLNDKIRASISRNASGMRLSIDYKAESNDKFSVSLYNLSGMQLFGKDMGNKKKGFYNDYFVINSISKGVYVLTVFVNGTPYSKEISL